MAKTFNRDVLATKFETQRKGSGTDSSQAITMNENSGVITSSTTTLAAKTTEDITVTCNKCKSTSIVLAMASGGGTGDVVCTKVAPSNGSFVVTTLNADQTNACNAAYVVRYVIF